MSSACKSIEYRRQGLSQTSQWETDRKSARMHTIYGRELAVSGTWSVHVSVCVCVRTMNRQTHIPTNGHTSNMHACYIHTYAPTYPHMYIHTYLRTYMTCTYIHTYILYTGQSVDVCEP